MGARSGLVAPTPVPSGTPVVFIRVCAHQVALMMEGISACDDLLQPTKVPVVPPCLLNGYTEDEVRTIFSTGCNVNGLATTQTFWKTCAADKPPYGNCPVFNTRLELSTAAALLNAPAPTPSSVSPGPLVNVACPAKRAT